MRLNVLAIFERDEVNHGVRRINILVLQLIYGLMFVMLGQTVWTHILGHQGPWQADDAMSWSVWAAFSLLAGFGIFQPLKMLPIMILEIVYKSIWLGLVAYPLWSNGQLAGAPEEYQAHVFLGIIVPILAVPWGYALRTFTGWRPRP
jgi:hypothetical protein